jgi:hypothetical protein
LNLLPGITDVFAGVIVCIEIGSALLILWSARRGMSLSLLLPSYGDIRSVLPSLCVNKEYLLREAEVESVSKIFRVIISHLSTTDIVLLLQNEPGRHSIAQQPRPPLSSRSHSMLFDVLSHFFLKFHFIPVKVESNYRVTS